MAVWQHDYELIPQSKLREFYGDIPATVSPEDYERKQWWTGIAPPDNEWIGRLLPPTTCWSDKNAMWGSEDGDRITLIYSEERELVEIAMRIDLRQEYPVLRRFVEAIVGWAKDHEYAFLNDENRVLMPEYLVLAKDLNMSGAQEFVNEPIEFLKRKGEELREEE